MLLLNIVDRICFTFSNTNLYSVLDTRFIFVENNEEIVFTIAL